MTIHLTSIKRVREPGFSRSECLELARRIEAGGSVCADEIKCENWDCEGRLDEPRLSCREQATIIAALRAYAQE